MKTNTICLYLLLCFCSCNGISHRDSKAKESFRSFSIPTEVTGSLSGEILMSGKHYYDLFATSSYYAFLDYYSDTILQVYSKVDKQLYKMNMKGREEQSLSNPFFIKQDTRRSIDELSLWENETRCYHRVCLMDQPQSPYVNLVSEPWPVYSVKNGKQESQFFMNQSNSIIITEKTFYGVPINASSPSVFFSFSEAQGYYYVPGYPPLDMDSYVGAQQSIAYLGNLAINEERGIIVNALRFINTINFYDLNCDPLLAEAFGDTYLTPFLNPATNEIDVEQTTKCFIDICSTADYVCCLYDGSSDYSNHSLLIVFDWDGTHLATIQTDRSLRKIVMDTDGNTLLALAATDQQGGREVVKYDMKTVL